MTGKEIAGRYRIGTKLGEGGMGAVYKAEQISLKRQVAVKLLRPDVAGTAIMLARFDAEAQAVARLGHPNTVGIYDFGQDVDGTFFIAMEFVEGKSLREVIHAEAPLPPRRALAIASQVAASLTDAHSHNIIHRDLKPDNVMLQTRGRQKDVARVLDFGIAKLRDEGRATQAAMTQAGDMLGTPQYMAPEQIKAEQIDGRTDVYALGCMLYEMITGRMPFEGTTVLAILSKHLMENPTAPSQRRPELGIPPAIDHLIMTAIAKDRDQRPPTMEIYGEQIAALLAQFPPEAGAHSGQGTAQISAQVAAPGMMPTGGGQPSYGTPQSGAYGYPSTSPAGHSPALPGGQAPALPGGQAPALPGGQAPGMYPPGPPTGPPPGYGTPQAMPSPVYGGVPTPGAIKPGGGSKTMLFAIIGAVVLIGGGVGIFLATRKPDVPAVIADAGTEAAADAADKPDKPDKPDKVDPVDKPDKPDDGDADPDDEDGDETPTADDPWAAGGGGDDTAAQVAALMTGLSNMKAKMCACKDASCVSTVTASATQMANAMAKLGAKLATLDAATIQKMTQLQTEMTTCATRAMAAAKIPAEAPPKPAKLDLNVELDKIVNRACACRDAACGRGKLRELLAFVRRHKGNDDGDEARAKRSGERMVQCLITAGVTQQELVTAFQQLQSM
jgi:serine/threonine-protein kinase